MIEHLLPYFEKRTEKVDTIVLHCLAFEPDEAIQSFHESKVSAHYMIGLRGEVYKLVPENKVAWHAGKSYWQGKESLNQNSIGIEICSLSLGQEPYDMRQIHSLIDLCKRIVRKYHIKQTRIVGHSDIAPTRKPDPGKAFPWEYLARHNLGLWYGVKDADKIRESDESKLLSLIGYDTTNLGAAKYAFCRRFQPDQIATNQNIYNLLQQPYRLDSEIDLRILQAVCYKYMLKK